MQLVMPFTYTFPGGVWEGRGVPGARTMQKIGLSCLF